MKHKPGMILTVVALFGLSVAQAQDRRPITLNEAIDLSVKNSKQLKLGNARIEEATASVREATDRKLPDASATGAYMRLNHPLLDIKTKSNNTGGGTTPPADQPNVNQAMYGMVNLSLPIYTGGRIRYGIESARYLAQAAQLDVENDRNEVIENTVEAYVNLYKAGAAVNLVKENLAEAQQRVKDFSNLEKNGILARNDLLKAELQASNTELSLLDAQNNLQLANVNMDLMLGLPEQTELVPDSSLVTQNFNEGTLDEYLQAALKGRKDIEALGLRKEAAELGVQATKGEYKPGVQLTGGYVAAKIPSLLTVANAVNIGVGVSYSISSLWKTKAKVTAAEARAKQLEANQEMMNDQVRLQVNRAYLNYLSSKKKIDVYAKAVEQATENYRIVHNKYENSLATTTDLLDADVAQLQARMNLVFAKADAVVAYNQLLQASGQIAGATK
jgi:outer membrane protein